MKCIAVIGAGQLGSRHLQGLVKYLGQLEIYVLDPSSDSLKIAQERESEITHNHKIVYTQSWEKLPFFFDIVIIATNANIREAVINKLLENHKVHFLILEKVLFQELCAYQRIKELLIKHNVVTYVNHPRRMFVSYRNIKSKVETNSQSVYNIVGGNWGLGCNAVHFLDLLVYLSGKKLCDLDVNSVENELLKSSREGFVEFTGTITGHLSDNSFFSITSFKGESSPITVTIFNNNQRFIIQEGGTSQSYYLEKDNLYCCNKDIFKVQNQSELTTDIVNELFEKNYCLLPSYEEAMHTHELFLTKMLEKYNKITELDSIILPIT